MGAPNPTSLTPNTKVEGYTAFDADLVVVDAFERDNHTWKETFTQSGTDTPASGWKGSAVQGDGYVGDCFVGDGTTAWIDRTVDVDAGAFSFSLFGKLNSALPIGLDVLFGLYDTTLGIYTLTFGIRPDGQIQVYQNNGSSSTTVRYMGLSDYQSYHNIQVIWNGSTASRAQVYIDEVEKTIDYVSGSQVSKPASDKLMIGAFDYGGNWIDGDINDLYYYNSNWSSTDRLKYSNTPSVGI